MASPISLGKAYVVIGGDRSALGKTLASVRKDIQGVAGDVQKAGAALMALGTAIQAPLLAAAKSFATFGDNMAKAAKRAGVSSAAFSELAHVAGLSGSGAEGVEKAFRGLARTLYDADYGLKTAKDALAAIGLTVQDLRGLSPEDQFARIADGLAKVQDVSTRSALSMRLFGRAGTSLLPMLSMGAAGIAHYREEARRLGVSLSGEQASAAELLTDMWARLRAAMQGLSVVVGQQVTPALVRVITYMTNLIANFREYLANNPQIVETTRQVAVAMVAVGAALVGIGTAGKYLALLVSPGGVLAGLAAVLLYVSGALDPLIEKWGKVVGDFEVGGKKISDWLALLGDAWTTLTPAFDEFAGALEAAFRGAWEGIKNGWSEVMAFIISSLRNLLETITNAMSEVARTSDSAITRSMARSVQSIGNALGGKLQGAQFAQEDYAAGGKGLPDAWFGIANRKMSSAGGMLKDALAGITQTIVPAVQGAWQAATESGPVKGLADLFRGINTEFAEFPSLAPGMAGGGGLAPATLPKFLAGGSWSGREAEGQFGQKAVADKMLQESQKHTKVLERIADGIDGIDSGYGD
jgi:TP901 family phage tail tape measure protein